MSDSYDHNQIKEKLKINAVVHAIDLKKKEDYFLGHDGEYTRVGLTIDSKLLSFWMSPELINKIDFVKKRNLFGKLSYNNKDYEVVFDFNKTHPSNNPKIHLNIMPKEPKFEKLHSDLIFYQTLFKVFLNIPNIKDVYFNNGKLRPQNNFWYFSEQYFSIYEDHLKGFTEDFVYPDCFNTYIYFLFCFLKLIEAKNIIIDGIHSYDYSFQQHLNYWLNNYSKIDLDLIKIDLGNK